MKRIGILTSGGDAPGMNACIRAVVRNVLDNGMESIGIKRGYTGLIEGDMVALDRKSVANVIHRGGTMLETSRCPEFTTPEGRAKAIKALKEAEIDGLVLLGGDGTFRGGALLANECSVSISGVPTTIDNDVYGTDYTVGFDTAVNTALEAIDRIRDTALSHERLFFVEVMGHHTGFIALESGIAGGAEETITPETGNTDDLWTRLRESFEHGKKSAIVVVAEGDQPGHTFAIAQEAKDKLKIESRVCILGHVQRGGSPTAHDRVLASNLGSAAVSALLKGKSGYMVGQVKNEIVYTALAHTWGKKKALSTRLEELASLLSA
ncbi:MAG: 6-phosphofructokinase [Dehalococcoidia bacterium]|nr:6-phosphofructokinase [Dehalococcoidia bacterium]